MSRPRQIDLAASAETPATNRPTLRGYDPGQGNVVAPPDDPGEGKVVAPPDDPSPRYGSHGGHGCGCLPACCRTSASCPSPANAATQAGVPEGTESSGFVIVRLVEGFAEHNFTTLIELALQHNLAGLLAALRLDVPENGAVPPQARARRANPPEPDPKDYLPSRPLIRNFRLRPHREEDPDGRSALRQLESQAAGRWPNPGPSLLRYWRVDCRSYPERLPVLLEQLAKLPSVDLAYHELHATDPAVSDSSGIATYGSGQTYLDDAPVGIGARGAWRYLSNQNNPNDKVRLIDLEQRWILDHDELVKLKDIPTQPLFGDNRFTTSHDGNHGTAVLAQLAAEGNSVEGIATQVTKLDVVSHWDEKEKSSGNVAEAIVNALVLRQLGSYDLLLLEVQRSGGPTERDIADATAIQLATALGVTVIEAAGNGGLDLDALIDPEGRPALRRGANGFRETGAVMVGAAWSTLPHDRAGFSSYGSRVDCYGWGDSVLTAGYGDLDPGNSQPPQMYTHTFSGTSSASPCVAGAAVLLQCFYKNQTQQPLAPRRLREILADPATGTPQGPNVAGAIGVMPNLGAILASGCGMAPHLYLRRSTADDGLVCRDLSCSSPDVFACTGQNPNTNTASPGGLDDNAPAPGVSPLPATGPLVFFVRARNRGLGTAEDVRARFYTAEVATFLSPQMWQRVIEPAGVSVGNVQQGDLPVLVGGYKWPPPNRGFTTPEHRAILAILSSKPNPEPFDPLPKLYYCFNWDEYRQFLERPEVGCRNTHWASAPYDLRCLVTGTPDRARTFDVQILQRLPQGVKVELKTTPLLARLLIHRQPWLAATSGQALELPNDPCLTFKDIGLQAGARHETFLRLIPAPGSKIERGHGLVIRQLYRGREIGRITWYFTG